MSVLELHGPFSAEGTAYSTSDEVSELAENLKAFPNPDLDSVDVVAGDPEADHFNLSFRVTDSLGHSEVLVTVKDHSIDEQGRPNLDAAEFRLMVDPEKVTEFSHSLKRIIKNSEAVASL